MCFYISGVLHRLEGPSPSSDHDGGESDLAAHEVGFNETMNAPNVMNSHENNGIRKYGGRNELVCVKIENQTMDESGGILNSDCTRVLPIPITKSHMPKETKKASHADLANDVS